MFPDRRTVKRVDIGTVYCIKLPWGKLSFFVNRMPQRVDDTAFQEVSHRYLQTASGIADKTSRCDPADIFIGHQLYFAIFAAPRTVVAQGRAVQLIHGLAARGLVQAVDVLGHDGPAFAPVEV